MATIKSYTDLEQSKKLAEILPLESADMWYQYTGISIKDGSQKPIYFPMVIRDCESDEDIPCWSLAALFGVLPKQIEIADNVYSLSIYLTGLYYWNVNNGNLLLEVKDKDNLVDACVEMIEKLHELNLL